MSSKNILLSFVEWLVHLPVYSIGADPSLNAALWMLERGEKKSFSTIQFE